MEALPGIYRDGKIELLERPREEREARVIVTFLPADGNADLRERGISEQQAADLRTRLAAFAEDWNRSEMDIYDRS